VKIGCIITQYGYGKKENGLSLEYKFTEIFKALGHEVYCLWTDDCDKFQLAQRMIIFNQQKYDFIFFMPMLDEIPIPELDILSESQYTVAWFGDDTWRFENYSKYFARHFKHIITTDKFSLGRYRSLGCDVTLSQWGSLDHASKPGTAWKYAVSFVGGYSAYRRWIEKNLKGYNIYFGSGVSDDEMKEIISTSVINLNLSNSLSWDVRCIFSSVKGLREVARRRKTAEQIKARNFEIPALGGFQLSNYVLGLEDYLKIGEEVAVFTTIESLKTQINYYLTHEEERQKILVAGHQRAITEHLYIHRIRKFLKEINEAIHGNRDR